MKKILIIETSAFRGQGGGGSFQQAQYYLNLLMQKGYDASIFTGDTNENWNQKKLNVVRRIREADYVIGFGTPLLGSYLQWACFFLGKKGIYCIDTYISSRDIIKDHLKRGMFPTKIIYHTVLSSLLNKLFMFLLPPKMNLAVICSCQYIFDKLKHTRIKSYREGFLYPRIDLNKRIGVSKKYKTILFYGTLYRGRGVVDLLNACRLLWKKGLNFKLSLYGFPVDQYTKQTLTRELKRSDSDRIIMKENVDDIDVIVKNSTVVVLPFRYPCSFQTPYTLLEPMRFGVPVITTNVGSHGEWIIDGETGLMCEKENTADIAEKIETVFKDKKLVDRITAGAYRLLKKRYKEKDLLLETLKRLEDEG